MFVTKVVGVGKLAVKNMRSSGGPQPSRKGRSCCTKGWVILAATTYGFACVFIIYLFLSPDDGKSAHYLDDGPSHPRETSVVTNKPTTTTAAHPPDQGQPTRTAPPKPKDDRDPKCRHVIPRVPSLRRSFPSPALDVQPEATPAILPAPAHAKIFPHVFRLRAAMGAYIGEDVPEAVASAVELRFLCDFGVVLDRASADPLVHVFYSATAASGSYELDISQDTLRLTAGSTAGVSASIATLKQLMPSYSLSPEAVSLFARSEAGVPVRAAIIRDKARYSYRGLLIDSARHFISVEKIEEILFLMSSLKINILHWHLTDDQGFRLFFPDLPFLAEYGGRRGPCQNPGNWCHSQEYSQAAYYTAEDVERVKRFASSHDIAIVPEIGFPAHSAALIRAAGTQKDLDLGVVELHEGCADNGSAEANLFAVNCMGGTHGMFIPTPSAVAILEGIIRRLLKLFDTSPAIHLGGDEADQFRDSVYKKRSDLMSAWQVTTPHELQISLLNHMASIVQQAGKKVIAWDDSFLTSQRTSVTPTAGTVMMWWRDWHPDAREAQLPKAVPKILTPTSKAYLDIYQMEPHTRSIFGAQQGTVTLKDAFSLSDLDIEGTVGVQGSLWGEMLSEERFIDYQLFPRLIAIAHAAWAPLHSMQYETFRTQLDGVSARYEFVGVFGFREDEDDTSILDALVRQVAAAKGKAGER